jgi:hypothetical protein
MRVFGVRPYQPSARRVYQPAAFRHRRDCHAEAGSFFDVVPSGADAHLLKHVIHDWHDARAAAVGPRCARRPGCWIVEGPDPNASVSLTRAVSAAGAPSSSWVPVAPCTPP